MIIMEKNPEEREELILKFDSARIFFAEEEEEEEASIVVSLSDITDRKQAEKVTDSIYRISEATHSAQNLEELFRSIHHIVGELIQAKNFYIALYDPTSEIIRFPYFVDEYDEIPAPKKFANGLTEYVLRTGKPLLASPEVFEKLVKKGEVEQIGTPSSYWVGVPLKKEDKTIGILAVQSYDESVRFGEEEKDILGFVSDQVAMAIEHKRAEEAIRESENRYRTLFEGVPMGLYRTTPEGRILDVNPTLIKMLRYPDRKSLIAKNAKDLYADPKVRKLLKTNMARDGIVNNFEYRIRQYDGEIIWVQDTARVVIDDKGLVLFYEGSLQDITERKKSEEELLEAKQKAEKALNELKEYQTLMVQKERLAVLGELSAGLAHEINNPLSIISGYVQMLLMDEHVNSEIKEISRTIEKQVERASNIADKLLHFSKKTDFEIKEVDLNRLVDNILILLEHQLKLSNILVVKQMDPTLGSIQADPPQLQQVFHNIISNAIYAMPKGGTLTVSTGLKDGNVEIRFADTGCGIPKKNLNRIFDPFFTTKESGTGLGLSIAYGIIDAHRGQIEVESKVNKGTTFILKLPVKNRTKKRTGKNDKNFSC